MRTSIDWTDHTLNPGLYGCTEVSPACRNCYAAKMAHRQEHMGNYPVGTTKKSAAGIHWSGRVTVDYDRIEKAFAKLPKRKPARVFVTSMSDLFHEDVPFEFVDRVFVEMSRRQHLTFQVLTKRAERMLAYAKHRDQRGRIWPPNVWAGTTVEDQKRADERIPHLLRVPAKVRFLSCVPLVGPVDLSVYLNPVDECCGGDGMGGCPGLEPCHMGRWPLDGDPDQPMSLHFASIHWVITGGESGPGARPSNPEWFRSLRDQCAEAGVPFFFKQWGRWVGEKEYRAVDESIRKGRVVPQNWPDGQVSITGSRVDDPKTLDEVEHRAFPGVV